jgi:hypothetical protein
VLRLPGRLRLVRSSGAGSGGCDDDCACGDGFEALGLWQEAPCFVLVIFKSSDSADAAGIACAEFLRQLEGVGHQREEHCQVAEVAFWPESVVGAGRAEPRAAGCARARRWRTRVWSLTAGGSFIGGAPEGADPV